MTFGNTKTGKTGTSTSEATETAQIKSVESLDKGNDMERGLKNRHVQFIAIGGTIGTGLFLGSGKSIALTGPSIILVYIGVGLIMFLLMRAIGEMMYSDPSQHTFINFITRYLGRGWGKFAGWTYWIVLILTGMTEITAVSTYFVTFFGTFGIDLNAWKWLIELCFLVALTGINLIAVKVFGEAEFWFSMIKITLIVGLIVTAVVMLFLGFSYPATHIEGVDGTVSGATVSLTNITDGFQLAPNGWMNFFMSFQMVFFAYQLIEFVGVTVSETQNPRKVLPKAVNELIMRILIFYVGALVAIMAIVGLMSGVLSNTGTAAVLIPVVIGIAAKSGYARSKLLMPLVFAAAMGGNLSLIGAPGNLIAQSALGEIGMSFGFFEYAIVGLPILAAGILFYATLGMKLLPNHPVSDDDSFGGEQDFSNVPKWKQVLSLVILVLTLLGMIFEKQIGIKLNITGCIGALALILTGVISEKDALKSIDLKTIFLFGGTLSLASALDKTGAGAEIANIVIGALGENPSPYVLTLVVFLLCCVMTNFMSNTATTALMVPICLSIAQGMGADPRAVLMACVIGGSCAYATPIGMPANTMVVSAGGYTFKDYAKAGLPLILIATVVSMVILPIAFPFFPQ